MRIIVDQNLPPLLAAFLNAHGAEAVHVRDLGFSAASDHRIWRELIAPGAVLITRDLDLATIVKSEPSAGHVVLISVGNCRNRALIALFERRWTEVQRRLTAGQRLIELA